MHALCCIYVHRIMHILTNYTYTTLLVFCFKNKKQAIFFCFVFTILKIENMSGSNNSFVSRRQKKHVWSCNSNIGDMEGGITEMVDIMIAAMTVSLILMSAEKGLLEAVSSSVVGTDRLLKVKHKKFGGIVLFILKMLPNFQNF